MSKRIPMTHFQIKLFTFYYSELNIIKSTAKRMCRNVEDHEDKESQDKKMNRLRQFRRLAGPKTRYSEWESLSPADYFFEEEELPVPQHVLKTMNIDDVIAHNKKMFRDVFNNCIE
jgi:hypothetical protein